MALTLYLLENRQKMAQDLVNPAIKGGFEVFIFKTFANLAIDLQDNDPEAILVNAQLLPSTLEGVDILSRHLTFVYGNRIELDFRLDLYQLGIRRVLDSRWVKPQTLINLLKIQDASRGDLSSRYSQAITRGSHKNISLPDQMLDCLMDGKSAAIKLTDNRRFAKIRLQSGHIVDALAGDKKGSGAVFEVLHQPWSQILLKFYEEEEVPAIFGASTFAILEELRYQNRVSQQLMSDLGGPGVILEKVSGENPGNFSREDRKVLGLLDLKQGLKKFFRNDQLPLLRTVRTIQSLNDRGIIKVSDKSRGINPFLGGGL